MARPYSDGGSPVEPLGDPQMPGWAHPHCWEKHRQEEAHDQGSNGRCLALAVGWCALGAPVSAHTLANIRSQDAPKYDPKLSEVLQGSARTVGIDIKIQTWDPTVFFQKIAQQDYDIWTLSVPYTSAGNQMYLYYHSKSRPVPNCMMWNDAETDRLLDAGRTATTDAEREKNFKEVQRKVHDEALMIPAAHSRLFLVAKKSIKGVRAHGIYSAALYKGSIFSPELA
jgi:ABC-type transport system substrate-binding protein